MIMWKEKLQKFRLKQSPRRSAICPICKGCCNLLNKERINWHFWQTVADWCGAELYCYIAANPGWNSGSRQTQKFSGINKLVFVQQKWVKNKIIYKIHTVIQYRTWYFSLRDFIKLVRFSNLILQGEKVDASTSQDQLANCWVGTVRVEFATAFASKLTQWICTCELSRLWTLLAQRHKAS